MKKKILKLLSACAVATMMCSTAVMAASAYNISISVENVAYSGTVAKTSQNAYASVIINSLNYPSATLKYKVNQGNTAVTSYYSRQGVNTIPDMKYLTAISTGENLKLGVYNPASNGGVGVTVYGTWTP